MLALLLYTPAPTVFATLALKVIVTLPLGGMLNVPHVGEVAPAVGSTMAVRVAPPTSTGAVLEAKLKPVGSASLIVTPVAVLLPELFTVMV